jgi:hypothetical protein
MSRRIEGTTLGGFRCDYEGCDQNGAFAPMLIVPWKGLPEQVKAPIETFVDMHFCKGHFGRLSEEKVFSKTLRKGISEFAEERKGHADFTRARIVPYPTTSQRFLEFQQRVGLVPPDDAVIKGSIAPLSA